MDLERVLPRRSHRREPKSVRSVPSREPRGGARELMAYSPPAILYHSSADAHDVAAELAKKWDTQIVAYKCDVGDAALVKKTFALIESELGQITGLIAVRTSLQPRVRC